jgi:hypothetical protein
MQTIPKQYQSVVYAVMQGAREIFNAGNQVSAIVFLCKLDGKFFLPIALDCSSGSAKEKSAAKAAFIAKETQPDFVIMVSESWTIHTSDMTPDQIIEKYGSISECPFKTECIHLSLETPEGTWLALAPIITENGVRKLEPFEFTAGMAMQGRFTNFLTKPNQSVH